MSYGAAELETGPRNVTPPADQHGQSTELLRAVDVFNVQYSLPATTSRGLDGWHLWFTYLCFLLLNTAVLLNQEDYSFSIAHAPVRPCCALLHVATLPSLSLSLAKANHLCSFELFPVHSVRATPNINACRGTTVMRKLI